MCLTRILLTCDAVGGVWDYTRDLAHGLAALGMEPVVAVLGPGMPDPDGLDVVRTGLPLDWLAPDADSVRAAARALAGLAARLGAGSVHLHAPAYAAAADWPVPVVAVAHSCVATWWRAVRGPAPLPPDLAWRADLTGRGLEAAGAVIAPTAAFAGQLRAAYGTAGAICVIHNGGLPLDVAPVKRERAVLAAGRLWDEAKGMPLLDRAAALIDAPVRAAGPTQSPGGGELRFATLSCLGTLDRPALAQAMHSASVFAAPSFYEPFGLAVLQAAQAGMALVLADIPGFRELWDDAAVFVPPGDEPALAAGLRQALATPEPLGRAARARAERYGRDAMAAATCAVHQGLRQRRAA